MNEKSDPRTRLIADTFNEDWVSGPAGAFAYRSAAYARRRRFLRKAILSGSCVAAAITAILLITHARVSSRFTSAAPAARPITVLQTPVKNAAPTFEIISDEELIAELRDRPLLVLPQQGGGELIAVLRP